jgi:AcrR family transcriptional regulator
VAPVGNKDGLVAAYLDRRAELTRQQLNEHLERGDDPRETLLKIFDSLVGWYSQDDFRGCHFIHAGSELSNHEHPALGVLKRHRTWVKNLFEELSDALGAPDPDLLAAQLLMLYDGATVAADLDRYPQAARAARLGAERLIGPAAG